MVCFFHLGLRLPERLCRRDALDIKGLAEHVIFILHIGGDGLMAAEDARLPRLQPEIALGRLQSLLVGAHKRTFDS